MKLLLLVLALTFNMASHVIADEYTKIEVDGVMWDWSPEWSFGGWGKETGISIPPGTTVYASIFDREEPGSIVFDENMTGVIFLKTHLMNVTVPQGNTVIDCWTGEYKVQNDGEDWILDKDRKPKEPIGKEIFKNLGVSTMPEDIPVEKLYEPITITKTKEDAKKKQAELLRSQAEALDAP